MDQDPRISDGRGPVSLVRTRDGRDVPYDSGRIERAVGRAQVAVGEDDPAFAREVADVVGLALASRHARWRAIQLETPVDEMQSLSTPHVEEIQDLVEQALIEMGRARAAKAYILYRDRRARAREALRVDDRELPDGVRLPRVRQGAGQAPWSRGRIVAALMEEAELGRDVAEEVARRVERRVLDSGLRRLSTSLIREFVDNELGGLGLDTALRRQEAVGLPRYDLRQLLGEPPKPTAEAVESGSPDRERLTETVGTQVLERYLLEELFNDDLGERLRNGDLHLVDVSRPHQALTRSVPAELLLRREPSREAPFDLLCEVAPLVATSARGLVVEDVYTVLEPLGLGADGGRGERARAGLRDFLRGLVAVGRGAGRRVDLARPGGARSSTFLRALLGECAALAQVGARIPRLFLSWQELTAALGERPMSHELAGPVEGLLACGQLVPVWDGRDERWAAPGCRRRAKERVALACGGAVALNLPRLARRAGPWREDLLLAELSGAVASAVDALERLAGFQRKVRATRGELLRERVSYALVPVGVSEALRILGDGEQSAEQGARMLGLLAEAGRRFAEARALTVTLAPFFSHPARTRFAALDVERTRAWQPRLFADLPAPERFREPAYGAGYDLGSALTDPGGEYGRLLATVPSGALFPFPQANARAGALADPEFPVLTAWARFDATRRPSSIPTAPRRGAEPGPLFQGDLAVPAEA